MRPLWKGAISFGLVSIPVKMYAATEQKNVKFNYLHRECKTPIKYQKVCPACGREVGMMKLSGVMSIKRAGMWSLRTRIWKTFL